MRDRSIFLLIFALSLANGLLSPAFNILLALAPVWAPEIIWQTEVLELRRLALFHLTSFTVAFGTLAIAGVPAGLYERMSRAPNQRVALWIWLGGVVVLLLPMFRQFV